MEQMSVLSHRCVTLFEAASLHAEEALNAVSLPERYQLQIVDHKGEIFWQNQVGS